MLCDFFNQPWLEFTGRTMEEELGNGWADGVHPDDLEYCLRVYTSSFEARTEFKMEYRLKRHDGVYRWLLDHGKPRYDAAGAFMGYIGSCVDITERLDAERERERLTQQVKDAMQRQRSIVKEVLAAVTENRLRLCESADELPAPVCVNDDWVPVTLQTITHFRRAVREQAKAAGMARDRWQDLETAVGEAAMNAVVHAGGGSGRVCTSDKIQVWMTDRGPGIAHDSIHRATLEQGYSSAGTMGHGFSLMLQTADRVYMWTSSEGTTVVLEQDIEDGESLLHSKRM